MELAKTPEDLKKYANEIHFKINQLLDEVDIPENLSYDKKCKLRGLVGNYHIYLL